MATEVKHGKRARFKVRLQAGTYAVTVVGHYTEKPDLAAAGVWEFEPCSNRPVKIRAEMLALRSAFICWFVEEYKKQGGSYAEAIREIKTYPFHRILKRLREQRRRKC